MPQFIRVALGCAVIRHRRGRAFAPQACAPVAEPAWVPPGTPGSPIDGTMFHAQVLLSAGRFSSGVIDGKKGMSFKKAVQGFQESRGLDETGKLDGRTRQALLQCDNRPSTVTGEARPATDISGDYVYPFPKKPEAQAKLRMAATATCSRRWPRGITRRRRRSSRSTGPTALIGDGQALRLPNVLPTSARLSGRARSSPSMRHGSRCSTSTPTSRRATMSSSTSSEGVLKVHRTQGDRLVAQFPVTMGSGHDPLPLGNWKVDDLCLPAAVPLPAGPVLGRRRRQGGEDACRRARTGRSASPGSTSPRSITASTAPPSRRPSAAPKAMAASA